MSSPEQTQLLFRRYQLAELFHIPLRDINLKALLDSDYTTTADDLGISLSELEKVLAEPLDERWQLLERRAPLPANTLRCAVASMDGEWINGHFSRCPIMYVYDVCESGTSIVGLRKMPEEAGEIGHQERVNAINDCQLLFVAAIGGPAAARVIRADIYPMKVRNVEAIDQTLGRLCERLSSGSLPPWLKKVMGQSWQMADWSA